MIKTITGSERFSENGEKIYDFSDEFLVVCPKCSAMANVTFQNQSSDSDFHLLAARKLICLKCGLAKIWQGNNIIGVQTSPLKRQIPQIMLVTGGNFDWYFQETLWLQTECSGKTLWAYNKKHLEFIENYVAAKIRTRTPNINKSLASRLPQWIKSAKNRDEVLKAVGKLKDKLNGKS